MKDSGVDMKSGNKKWDKPVATKVRIKRRGLRERKKEWKRIKKKIGREKKEWKKIKKRGLREKKEKKEVDRRWKREERKGKWNRQERG